MTTPLSRLINAVMTAAKGMDVVDAQDVDARLADSRLPAAKFLAAVARRAIAEHDAEMDFLTDVVEIERDER